MGWKNKGGRRYYLICRTVNGQQQRTYAGQNEVGARAEAAVLSERTRIRQEQDLGLERERLSRRYEVIIQQIVTETLIGLGFEKRQRRWRKPKICNQRRMVANSEFQKKMQEEQGKIYADPIALEMSDDVAQELRRKSLAVFDFDLDKRRWIVETMEDMRFGLAGEGAERLDQIVADQIVNGWLQTAITGYRLESLEPTERNTRLAGFWETRHHQAHSRMIRSMELMARLRTLNVLSSPSAKHSGQTIIEVDCHPSPGSTWKDYGYESAEEMFFAEQAKNESRYGGMRMKPDENEN